MKLRNKKTGVIMEGGVEFVCGKSHNTSIARFTEEWEDYEEPEVYWFINSCGEVLRNIDASDYIEGEDSLSHKEIGNYFETQEEAEKAVEKLKAWKRLRDKGFQFESWFGGSKDISFWLDTEIDEDIAKDLELLFGGEE